MGWDDHDLSHRCEIHLLPVDPVSYQVLPVEKVLETVDSKYDELKDVYQEYGVETLMAASATAKGKKSRSKLSLSFIIPTQDI